MTVECGGHHRLISLAGVSVAIDGSETHIET